MVWTGEFGRTPRVRPGRSSAAPGRVATAATTGRTASPPSWPAPGIQGGTVHGASDRWAAYPARDPVTPADIAATIYHLLGVDPARELIDSLGRPLRLCLGEPIAPILA